MGIVSCVLLFFVAVLSSFLVTCNASRPDNHGTLAVTYVGQVDGKSFFADLSGNRNWTQAKQFCLEENMQFASVTSSAQNDLLKNNPLLRHGRGHWTDGRDALSHVQFVWDKNNNSMDNIAPFYDPYLPELKTCVFWYGGRFGAMGCAGGLYTLCELTHQGYDVLE